MKKRCIVDDDGLDFSGFWKTGLRDCLGAYLHDLPLSGCQMKQYDILIIVLAWAGDCVFHWQSR